MASVAVVGTYSCGSDGAVGVGWEGVVAGWRVVGTRGVSEAVDAFCGCGLEGVDGAEEPGGGGRAGVGNAGVRIVVKVKRRGIDFGDGDGFRAGLRSSSQANHHHVITRQSTAFVEQLQLQQVHLAQTSVRLAGDRSRVERIRQTDLVVLSGARVSDGGELQGPGGWEDGILVGEEGVVLGGEGDCLQSLVLV